MQPASWWLSKALKNVSSEVGIVEMTLPAKVAFVLASGTHMKLGSINQSIFDSMELVSLESSFLSAGSAGAV